MHQTIPSLDFNEILRDYLVRFKPRDRIFSYQDTSTFGAAYNNMLREFGRIVKPGAVKHSSHMIRRTSINLVNACEGMLAA